MHAPGTAAAREEGARAGAPVLRLDGLGWRVGGATIVEDVTFAVREGEFLAFIGPNGAGKTSLFNLVSGIVRPTAGTLALDGADLTGLPVHTRARRGSAGRSRPPASGPA